MPARTGKQYLDGLRDRPPEVHIKGRRVDDVTTYPGLAGGAALIGRRFVRHAARPGVK